MKTNMSKNPSYLKKIKDFPDTKNDLGSLSEAEVSAGILPIISNPTFSDLVKNHIVYGDPLDVKVKTKYGTSKTDNPAREAEILREELSKLIANKLENSKLETGDILPNKSEKVNLSQLPKKKVLEGTSGEYTPYTGNIQLDFNRPTKDIMKTYAHELEHKAQAQSIGYEKVRSIPAKSAKGLLFTNKSTPTYPPRVDKSLANEQFIPAKELINNYYRRHHRADSPNTWEIETLRNLEANKPIREPMTKDLSPEYKAVIEKSLGKGKK